MKLTENNSFDVLGGNPNRLFDVFPRVFDLLVDPELDEMALFNYVCDIQKHFQRDADSRPQGPMGFDTFGQAAFRGGIVKAMMKITKDPRTDRWHGLSSYFAMDAMWELTRTGTPQQRRELLKELLENDALNICIDKLQNHPLVIHRQVAACLLRCFSAESFLGEVISSRQASDLIVVLCNHILAGPDMYESQLANPQLTWQSFLSFGKFGAAPEMARKYAPRYYAMSQENAAWAIQGLFLRCPPPNQQFCREILSHNPEVLDLLFQCAATPRPPWYPELQVDSIVCEALTMLYRVPRLGVPGVTIKQDHPSQTETTEERNALIASSKLLTSRPDWVKHILAVWDMITLEKMEDVKRMFQEVSRKHYAQNATYTGNEGIIAVFEYRGTCRISLERLVTTLLDCATDTSISDADLLSLLRLADGASRKVEADVDLIDTQIGHLQWLESNFELYRKPLSAVFTNEEVEPPLQVACELVMGPTTMVKLLTLLAQRGILEKIPSMSKLPKGVAPRTTLSSIKDMASPGAIRSFLILARKRVTARREAGHTRFKDDETDYACIAYFTAAELAAALVSFDVATKGKYSQHLGGVRKELVLCLGNAAEMSWRIEKFDRALYFAEGAVEAADGLTADGGDTHAAALTTEIARTRLFSHAPPNHGVSLIYRHPLAGTVIPRSPLDL